MCYIAQEYNSVAIPKFHNKTFEDKYLSYQGPRLPTGIDFNPSMDK